MKKIIVLTYCLCIYFIGFSQQSPQYTQYMFNQMSINPAYSGTSDMLNITASSRRQWVGLEGAPLTNALSLNTPIKKTNLGTGVMVVKEQIGPINQTEFYANISYQISVTKNTKFSFGLRGGINRFDISLSNIEGVDKNDVAFFNDFKTTSSPNFGFGGYYYSPNKFYLGVSIPRFIKTVKADGFSKYVEQRHYFLSGGYALTISDAVLFKPLFLVKYVKNAPVSIDFSVNFLIHNIFWLGGVIRNKNTIGGILQFQIMPQLKLGYSYDYALNELQNYSTGSHEITLSYDFSFTKAGVFSPRIF